MADPISGLGHVNPALAPSMTGLNGSRPESGGVSFQKMLVQSLEEVNGLQQEASTAIETRLIGGDITSVEVYSAVKKADLALRMTMQIRNKILQAYNEIKEMRM